MRRYHVKVTLLLLGVVFGYGSAALHFMHRDRHGHGCYGHFGQHHEHGDHAHHAHGPWGRGPWGDGSGDAKQGAPAEPAP